MDFCCIIILMDNLAYLATNFYERDEHKPIEKFCTLCAVKGGGGRSPTQRFLPRSLVFYSKALQFLRVLCITTFCRLLDSFLSQPSNIDKVKWIKNQVVHPSSLLGFGPEEVKQCAKGRDDERKQGTG